MLHASILIFRAIHLGMYTLVIVLAALAAMSLCHGLTGGDIEFTLTGIPSTWEDFPNGMAQPRDSPTSEVDLEFSAEAESFSYSVVHATTVATSTAADGVALGTFDSYVLDMWIQHKGVLWPCVAADGQQLTNNLRVKRYDSCGVTYSVQADYVPNSHGEFFFNSTLSSSPSPSSCPPAPAPAPASVSDALGGRGGRLT
jgi:hypothetical protein